MTRSAPFCRSWLRSSRTVSRLRIDFVVAAGDEAGDEHALERPTMSSFGWIGVSIGISK